LGQDSIIGYSSRSQSANLSQDQGPKHSGQVSDRVRLGHKMWPGFSSFGGSKWPLYLKRKAIFDKVQMNLILSQELCF